MALGPVCFLSEVGYVDPTAIVSAVALGAIAVIWAVLLILTTVRGGGSAWRRGYVYYVAYSITLVGLMMLLTYSFVWELYWSEDSPNCVLPPRLLFMIVLGFPLALIPPFLINWRIYCLFSTSFDYKLRRVSPMHNIDRGMKWLMIRFTILFAPNIIAYILILILSNSEPVYIFFVALQSVMCTLLICVSIALILLKTRMEAAEPRLVRHALYSSLFSFLLAAVFVAKTITFFSYPSNQIAGDLLDLSVALSIFFTSLAVLLLWAHYFTAVGIQRPSSQERAPVTRLVMSGSLQNMKGIRSKSGGFNANSTHSADRFSNTDRSTVMVDCEGETGMADSAKGFTAQSMPAFDCSEDETTTKPHRRVSMGGDGRT